MIRKPALLVKNGGNMGTPIYQLFIGKNNAAANLAMAAVSEAERKALEEKEAASRQALNIKGIVVCDSAWADEDHPWWGVLRLPDLAARIQHTRTLREIGWLDRVEAFTLLGTSETEPEEVTIPNPIYKLWIVKVNPAAERAYTELSKEDNAALWEKHNAVYQQTSSKSVLTCDSYWCNEAYPWFGVSVYPSVEANVQVMRTLADIGWRRYFDSFTLLGIPIETR